MAGLALEYCRAVSSCRDTEPRTFVREMLRYLPRIYVTLMDLKPYGEDTDADADADETGAIYETVTEDQYNDVRDAMSSVLGENDMYLDTPEYDMQFSDTAVAVSLAEQLADIYQQMFDMAYTLRDAPDQALPMVVDDIKFRFSDFLSQKICDSLRILNQLYRRKAL